MIWSQNDSHITSCPKMEMTRERHQSLPISKKILHLCLPDLVKRIAGGRFSTYLENPNRNCASLLDTFERLQRQLPRRRNEICWWQHTIEATSLTSMRLDRSEELEEPSVESKEGETPD